MVGQAACGGHMSLKFGFAVAVAAVSLTTSAQAATQAYVAQGGLEPLTGACCSSYAYMEVWGFGATSPPYANPATDPGDMFNSLIASSSVLSAAALSGYTGASANFSYDPSAAPYFINSTGRGARYDIGQMTVEVSGAGAGPVTFSDTDNMLAVSRNVAGNLQVLNFTRKASTADGPIPGSTFSYSAGSSSTSTVDLVTLLGPSAYFVSGFDLSAFAALPVRLTTPTQFRPVGYSLFLQRNVPGAVFTTAPPASLNLADFNVATSVTVYFDGIYGVTVDPADYATNDGYLAASDWVSANIRQIDFEQSLDYTIGSLTQAPVPEPHTAWMLVAGLCVVCGMLAHRRRVT
jgi:hypothetical protein